ncbi:MAG: hypothetical protein ACREJB_16740 [Planctomycetaceae bacterium]
MKIAVGWKERTAVALLTAVLVVLASVLPPDVAEGEGFGGDEGFETPASWYEIIVGLAILLAAALGASLGAGLGGNRGLPEYRATLGALITSEPVVLWAAYRFRQAGYEVGWIEAVVFGVIVSVIFGFGYGSVTKETS